MSFNGPGIGGDVEQLVRPLSFGFQQPQVESVRRKPLNWNAASLGSGGAAAIGMAVPMGDSRREYEHRRAMSDISEESDITSRYEDARSEDS